MRSLALACLALVLLACGQKGPLVLPPKAPSSTVPAAGPAPASAPAPKS